MIAYAGYFGSGKTLNMTKDLYSAHKKGAFIITNYKTKFSNLVLKNQREVIDCFREILALRESGRFVGELLDINTPYREIYIGLDEAGVYFNAREYKEWSKFPDIMDFLLQCRKLRVEIFYTVQHPAFVDINFRRITTHWEVFKNVPFLPLVTKDSILIAPESANYSAGEIISRRLLWGGKSKIWDLYDTTELCFKERENDRENLFKLLKRADFHSAELSENQQFDLLNIYPLFRKKLAQETTD